MHQPQCKNGTHLLLQGGYPLWLGKSSFASFTVCLPLGGGGAHLYHPQCIFLCLEWRWGSFASATCHSLVDGGGRLHHAQCVFLYGGAICIIHSVTPPAWVKIGDIYNIHHSVSHSDGSGGGAPLHHPRYFSFFLGGGGGGAHLHHPYCVSLYMWGRGSFAECLRQSGGGMGLICIIHSVTPLACV